MEPKSINLGFNCICVDQFFQQEYKNVPNSYKGSTRNEIVNIDPDEDRNIKSTEASSSFQAEITAIKQTRQNEEKKNEQKARSDDSCSQALVKKLMGCGDSFQIAEALSQYGEGILFNPKEFSLKNEHLKIHMLLACLYFGRPKIMSHV